MQQSPSERSHLLSPWPAALCALIVLPLVGCGGSNNIERLENTERATTLWKTREHVCLEYATAASKLENQRANLAFPITGNQNVQLSYESTENLATIYTVSDILQFGHASLYRLCEAAGNNDLQPGEFSKLVQETLRRMSDLLEVQLAGPQMNAKDRVAQAWNRVQAARAGCLQAEDASQADPDALDRAQRRLVEAQEKLDELLRIYGLEESFASLAIDSNNLEKAWRDLELAKSKLEAFDKKKGDRATKDGGESKDDDLKEDVAKKRKAWENELKRFQNSRWLSPNRSDAEEPGGTVSPPPGATSAAPSGSAAPTGPAPSAPSVPGKKPPKKPAP